MDKLMEILEENWPDIDFSSETALVDDELFTSLDLVMLVGELNDAFDIEITAEDLLPENFNSAAQMYELIKRLGDA